MSEDMKTAQAAFEFVTRLLEQGLHPSEVTVTLRGWEFLTLTSARMFDNSLIPSPFTTTDGVVLSGPEGVQVRFLRSGAK